MRLVFKSIKMFAFISFGVFLYDILLTVVLDDTEFEKHVAEIEVRRARARTSRDQRETLSPVAPF